MMATSYWSPDGKPISANQMVENLFGELPRFFKDEDELRRLWSKPETRKALLQGLTERGFGAERLAIISELSMPKRATYSTCWLTSPLRWRPLRAQSE
jgi:type I restriction enzyme, R subunit